VLPLFALRLQSTHIRYFLPQLRLVQFLLLLRLLRRRDTSGFGCAGLDFPSRSFLTTGHSLALDGRMFLVRVRLHSHRSLHRRQSLSSTNTMNRFSKSKLRHGMREMY
jgi:hypothetical protein